MTKPKAPAVAKKDIEQPEYLLQFFEFGHLPAQLQGTSQLFHDLAKAIVASVPRNPERTMALRRLLEAKDCAIRAIIFK